VKYTFIISCNKKCKHVIGNPGISGFGGLIRNDDGAWISGVAGNIGFSNFLHAE